MNTYEQMRPLNTTDGWENIVNGNAVMRSSARERVAAWKRERRLMKLRIASCVMAAIGITFVILGATGAVIDWLATAVSLSSTMAGCFLLGRYVEAKKA